METPRPKFDPTISYGHVLQILMVISAVVIGWQNLDKRVVVLEENRNTQTQRDRHQDLTIDDKTRQIKESLDEIKAALLRLDNKIEALK